MLVMIDAIHKRFCRDDCITAWERLIDAEAPAISFHLLPIEKMGLSEDLYIKMNSRGKPLTPFENFKARFEQSLEAYSPDRAREFAVKVDGSWSDILWSYRGSDHILDDEFLRYFHFITEICEWLDGRFAREDITSRAEHVYCQNYPAAVTHLDFLFHAFDTWANVDVKAIFSSLFVAASVQMDDEDKAKIVLFGQYSGGDVDLFAICCRYYGDTRGSNRAFSWGHTILLYAVLLHRIHGSENFPRRLRVLRNLVEASNSELRLEKMPELLADVRRVVIDGSLDNISAFNQAQVEDERFKAEFLARVPVLAEALFRLEDHDVLRGCLAVFEFNEAVFEQRAEAFHRLFSNYALLPSVTGAMLAIGDYSRWFNDRMGRLGSGSNIAPWRELLVGSKRSNIIATRDVLARLLDEVATIEGNLEAALEAIQQNWLAASDAASGLGWRWYFVKYPAMREGRSGIYVGENRGLGYKICMLNKTQMNSRYRDPYLLAIHRQSGVGDAVEDPWFTGYETEPRRIRLKSGVELECVEQGFALHSSPARSNDAEAFSQICTDHGVDADRVLRLPQIERDGQKLDTCDRIQLGAALLRDLVNAGL
jgi:hypothetical protein